MAGLNFDKIGGRRFFLVLSSQVSLTALKWADKLGDDAFMWLILGTVAAYITGNTAQKIKGTAPGAAP